MKSIQPNAQFACTVTLTEELKTEVFRRLSMVSPETLLGMAYLNFSSRKTSRSGQDFQELLSDMHVEIHRNPAVVRKVLGQNFEFFCGLLFVD